MTFLPEPARRDRHALVISVDDHIVEPPDTFARHMPAKFADRAPRVVAKDDGTETWLYDGVEVPNIGLNAVAGKPPTSTAAIRSRLPTCAGARGTSTAGLPTWTSTVCTRR